MNYRLSVATVRTKGKHGFVLEKGGYSLVTRVTRLKSLNIKEDILSILAEGLLSAKGFVEHEDTLYIEIQNVHLYNWLSGMVDYKDYAEGLDKIFDILDSIDCRYKFVFEKNPYAKKVVEKIPLDDIKGSSVSDVLNELESNK